MIYKTYMGTIDSIGLVERMMKLQMYHLTHDNFTKKRGDLKKEEVYSQDETKKDLQEPRRT